MAVQHGTLGVWIDDTLDGPGNAGGGTTDGVYAGLIQNVAALSWGSRVDFLTLAITRSLSDQDSTCQFDLLISDSDTVPAIGSRILVAERNIASWTPTGAVEDATQGSLRLNWTLSASAGARNRWTGYSLGWRSTADGQNALARVISNDGTSVVSGQPGVSTSPIADSQFHYVLFGGVIAGIEESEATYGVDSSAPGEYVRLRVSCRDWITEFNSRLRQENAVTVIRTVIDNISAMFARSQEVYALNVYNITGPALSFQWEPCGEILRAALQREGLQGLVGGDRSIHAFGRYTYGAPLTIVETTTGRGEHSIPRFVQDFSNLYNAIICFSSVGTSAYTEVLNLESMNTYGRRDARLADNASSRPNVALEASALVQEFSLPRVLLRVSTTSEAAQRLEPGQLLSVRSVRRNVNRPYLIRSVRQRCLGYDPSLGRYVWRADLEATDVFGIPPTPDQVLARLIRQADQPQTSAVASQKAGQPGDFEQARITPSVTITVT